MLIIRLIRIFASVMKRKNMRYILYAVMIVFVGTKQVSAQELSEFQKKFQTQIKPTTTPIKIDGVLDEPCWQTSEIISHFYKKFPNDFGETKYQTEVKMSYDDKHVYFAFKAYDTTYSIIRSLKRDIGHDGSDGVAVILDPTNQRTNGFFFIVNEANVQTEDQLTGSMEDKPNFSWDTKWYSATKRYDKEGFWVAEIAIPLKSIRFDPNQQFWGINFLRIDAKNNEYSTWAKVPTNFRSYDLGYLGVVHFPTTLAKNGSNIILLPYITGSGIEDRENHTSIQSSGTAGFDAKIALNSSLNLDLTTNPDFSQIEVDQQQTNLSRFSIFLPEKRTFFLENADLFSNFGIPPIRPFYSRTIGLDKDGNKIPIIFGARLSGNLNSATRIGIMDMQTGKQGNYSPENFSAFTVHRRVFARSSIKAYFLNRENYISEEEARKNPLNKYGRNAGGSFEYSNLDGSVSSWISYNHSIKENISDNNFYAEGGFATNNKHWSTVLEVGNVGKNFYTDMGYVQRINNYDALNDTTIRMGYKNIFASLGYTKLPEKGKISRLMVNFEDFIVFNPDNSFNEGNARLNMQLESKSTSSFNLSFENTTLHLLFPTAPTGATPLPTGRYSYTDIGFNYNSDYRKAFSYGGGIFMGGYYNGTLKGAGLGFNLRKQPHLNFGLRSMFNYIELPDTYGSATILLIQPRIEYNFNTKLFWNTFIQYNTQSNNFSINSRLQYRYKPMSDFYLVYTDNYFTDPMFKNKNRALIFKFSYWFNL